MGFETVHSTEDLTAALVITDGNVAAAAREVGMSATGLHHRIKRERALQAVVAEQRLSKRRDLIADRKRKRDEAKNIAAADSNSENQVHEALILCEGDIIEAARRLSVHPTHLRKRISRSSRLRDALLEGEEYKIMEAEKLYKDVALGREKIDGNARSALADFLKCKGNWSAKSTLKVEGLAYDVESVPLEDVEPDLPN